MSTQTWSNDVESSDPKQDRIQRAAAELADAMTELGAAFEVRARVTGMMVPKPNQILYRYGVDVLPTDDDAMARQIEATQAEWLGERPRAAATWRPIGTAPRNGTNVLVGMNIGPVWIVHVAFWRNGDEPECKPEDRGWWSYTIGAATQEQLDGRREPTHWMPMPLPPPVRY